MPICSSGTQCPLYSAASPGQHVTGPYGIPPSHIILTPGRPVMFHGPHFLLSAKQAATTTIFRVFGMNDLDAVGEVCGCSWREWVGKVSGCRVSGWLKLRG